MTDVTDVIHVIFKITFWVFLTASMAQRRGYPAGPWMLLGIGMNWLMLVFVLAKLPDRTVDRQRAREASILRKQLARAVHGALTPPVINPGRSLGDVSTLR